MRNCSVTNGLVIEKGLRADYDRLSRFHYRDCRLGVYAGIFVIKPSVGVIVYTMPSVGLTARQEATGGVFSGFDRSTRVSLLNKNIRCISRVVIDPRYRGLGLAERLVRETMPLMGVAIIEAVAVMGKVNPFFERAGMSAYDGQSDIRGERLKEALSFVGIETRDYADVCLVESKLESLDGSKSEFIEAEIRRYLGSYNKRRTMQKGIKRTRFVLSRIMSRGIYYIWFDPERRIIF